MALVLYTTDNINNLLGPGDICGCHIAFWRWYCVLYGVEVGALDLKLLAIHQYPWSIQTRDAAL